MPESTPWYDSLPPVQEYGGRYYTWLPKETNPSKVNLAFWDGEKDEWVRTVYVRLLPSKAWGSLGDKVFP